MVERIKLILKVNNITASRFADEIGVQRSSISHILSGRNMPSLDLVQKILKRFPEINTEWILNGSGSMMRSSQTDLFASGEVVTEIPQTEAEAIESVPSDVVPEQNQIVEDEIIDEVPMMSKAPEEVIKDTKTTVEREYVKETQLEPEVSKMIPERKIEKIVIFYNNKTYKEYFPAED